MMWNPNSNWRPSQGSSTAHKLQTNGGTAELGDELAKRGGLKEPGNHQFPPSTSPSSNNHTIPSRINTTMAASGTHTPKQAPRSHPSSQSKSEGRLLASGDDISEFISDISAETPTYMPSRAPTTDDQLLKQRLAQSTVVTTVPQGAAYKPAVKQPPRRATESPLQEAITLLKDRISARQTESAQPTVPKSPPPPHNTCKQQPRESPEEGEVTENTPDRPKSTTEYEQPLEGNSTAILRSNSMGNVPTPTRVAANGGPSGGPSDSHEAALPTDHSQKSDTSTTGNKSSSEVRQYSGSLAATAPEPRVDGGKLEHRLTFAQGTDVTEQCIAAGSSGQAFQNSSTGATSLPLEASSNPNISQALAQYLSQDKDLSDWLQFTGYHNVQYRARYLVRQRKIAELDRLRAELKEEDERDRPQTALFSQDHTITLSKPTPPSITTQGLVATDSGSNTLVSSTTNDITTSSEEAQALPLVRTVKRDRIDDEEQELRSGKVARIDHQNGNDRNHSTGHDDNKETVGESKDRPSRPSSPSVLPLPRGPSNYHSREYRRSASPTLARPLSSQSASRRVIGGPSQGFHSGAFRDGGHFSPPSSYRRYSDFDSKRSRGLDLGLPGESRFFIVKSYSQHNVETCMDDGLWLTQVQHTESLTSAFAKCKNVILVFSVNKSKAFQGYARMQTAPSPDTPSPQWRKALHWESSHPFRVEWICTTEMPFSVVHHLNNSLNEMGNSVIVGKDNQEIEDSCARELIMEMDERQEKHSQRKPYFGHDDRGWDDGRLTPPFSNPSGRGGYRGRISRGGHGSPRGRGRPYVKREWT